MYSKLYARRQIEDADASFTALSLSPRAMPPGRVRRDGAGEVTRDGSQTHRPSTEATRNRQSYTYGSGPQPGHVQKSPEHLLFESLRQTPEAAIVRTRDVVGRHARASASGSRLLKLSLEQALPRLRANDSGLVGLSLNQDIDIDSARALSSALVAGTVLQHLDVFGGLYPMCPPACCAMCDGVGASLSLQKLDLLGNKILDLGATALGAALGKSRSLTSVNLSYCSIGEPGGEALGEGLRQSRPLKNINLAGNAIKDIGAAALGRALAASNSLSSLNLSDCRISSQGCTSLCQGLEGNTALTHLTLGGNHRIQNAGAAALASVVRARVCVLRKLELWNCGIMAVCRHVPTCHIACPVSPGKPDI